METTLHTSGPLGALGGLAAPVPVRKTRRKRGGNTATGVGAQGISSAGRPIDQTVAREEDVSPVYARGTRGAIVEAMSDAALVELALTDDQDAFSMLVERYKDAVHNLAYRMLGNITEAEDVTQEAFVRAYTQLATYKSEHKFSTWLLSIASHLAIDQLRRRRFLALPLEDVPFLEWIVDGGAGPEQTAIARRTTGRDTGIPSEVARQISRRHRLALLVRFLLRGNLCRTSI